jgi:hypothetical protein
MDIFFNRARRARSKKKDELERIINIIEKFAPVKYRDDRYRMYYNYRSLSNYKKPLFSLLNILSIGPDPEVHDRLFKNEVFQKLKEFYDPKGRLSNEEALQDGRLKKKMKEVFQIFFDKNITQ